MVIWLSVFLYIFIIILKVTGYRFHPCFYCFESIFIIIKNIKIIIYINGVKNTFKEGTKPQLEPRQLPLVSYHNPSP